MALPLLVRLLLRRVASVSAQLLFRRLTSVLRKPRFRTDSPVADAKADAKADTRTANAAPLIAAASMPDSVDLLLRVVSEALLLRAASAVSKVPRLRAASECSAALDRREPSASEF